MICSATELKAMSISLNGLINNVKQYHVKVGDLYRRVFGTVMEIESGPGKGMLFDGGPDTPRFASGQYERPVQEAITSLLQSGGVCYDIGANLGFFSLIFGRLVGISGTVYAFEPVPQNASMIERNSRLNGIINIKVLRLALARDDGNSELLLARHVGGAVLKNVGVPPDFAGSLMVKTAAVDTLVESQQIKPPRIVKIDVEGAELDVLQGMERVLRRWKPTVILELDDETAAGCEEKVSVCQSFLHNLNYRIELLPNSYPDGNWFVRHFIARAT